MTSFTPSLNWVEATQRRAQLLHQQIAALQRLVSDSGGSDTVLQNACASCYRLLDELYRKDMPIAHALDNSDLLLHLEGEGLESGNPRLSLVTSIMGDVRKQMGAMIKTLVSSFNEGIEVPREIDFGLSSFAQGSLYLGFSLPAPGANQIALAGDPIFEASRQALETLGAVTSHIDEPHAYETIQRDFADPKLRDAALTAVGQLAPSGRRGISSLSIGGRALRNSQWSTLTPQTRQQVRSWLERPILGSEVLQQRGHVRAIDLDMRRFDLRRIDGGNFPDLRCIYPASFDARAKNWLDTIVTVRGQVETYQGVARLLQIQTILEDASSG